MRILTKNCYLYSVHQTLQIPLTSHGQVSPPSQLSPPEPDEGEPHPHQGQELQQGAQAGPQLQKRQGEIFIQD